MNKVCWAIWHDSMDLGNVLQAITDEPGVTFLCLRQGSVGGGEAYYVVNTEKADMGIRALSKEIDDRHTREVLRYGKQQRSDEGAHHG